MNALSELLKNIFIYGSAAALIGALVYPMQFLKVIRQQTGAEYLDIIEQNYKTSGVKNFYRGVFAYMIIQFFSNTSFAISEFFSLKFLSIYGAELTIFGILFRGFLASILETAMTIKSEVDVISANKGELMKKSGEISAIIASIFIRNSAIWFGSLWSIYFINKFHMNDLSSFFLSFVVGIIFGIISLPLDIVATHNCGDIEKLSIFQRLKKISFESDGYVAMYRGSIMRVIMMTCYSVGVVFVTMFFM